MGAKKDLLSFLFLESADAELTDMAEKDYTISQNLERLFEAAAEVETTELSAKKTPLAKALGDFGVTDAELQLDPEGFCLVTSDRNRYANVCTVLGTPEAMHKLAQMGWVVTKPGDSAMTSEKPEYRVRFFEITTVSTDDKEKAENVKAITKKASEFAATPLERDDDDLNPVEPGTGKMGKKNAGVGKPKDGADPEKAIHDALLAGDVDALLEMTTTHSMCPMESPALGLVAPGIGGKFGGKFKTPGQWTMKQPVVKQQVKRKVRSKHVAEAEDDPASAMGDSPPAEVNAAEFLGDRGPGPEEPEPEGGPDEDYETMRQDLQSGECVVFDDSHASRPTVVRFCGEEIGTITGEVTRRTPFEKVDRTGVQNFASVDDALRAVKVRMEQAGFYPNIYHVNDHGNISLWDMKGKEIKGWV